MVTDQYSHILDENRKTNAELIEKAFYEGHGSEPDGSSGAKKKPTMKVVESDGLDADQLAKLLGDPNVVNMLKVLSKTIGA